MNKVAVIIQCRLSSTRLPQKALKELNGRVLLEWVLKSMKKVKADYYYVATDKESFPYLKDICKNNNYDIFAGDLNNVLKRYCDLIKKLKVNTVVRATGDNPFLFYEAAQDSLDDYLKLIEKKLPCDYLTYSGLPHGSGVEIINAKSLLKAQELTDSLYDKEHVGPALYNHTDKFECKFIKAPKKYNYPDLRTTVDTYYDYLKAIKVVNYLESQKTKIPYSTKKILEALENPNVQNLIVYIPRVQKGNGTGHLHRCLKLALETNNFVYLPKDSSLQELSTIVQEYILQGLKENQIINQLPESDSPTTLVTDLFKLTQSEIELYSKYKSLISIDEGSSFFNKVDYLIDIIPGIYKNKTNNIQDAGFIQKPKKTKTKSTNKIENVLICLGGEDPANLTVPTCNYLNKILPKAKITAISNKKDILPIINNVSYIAPIQNLKEQLYKYDLVITHYGLTAYEALSAKTNVILLSTTKLHQNLAKKYKFNYVPFNKLSQDSLQNCITNIEQYKNVSNKKENKDLGEFITKLSYGKKYLCPICKSDFNNSIIERNLTKTYKRCSNCNIIYLGWSTEKEKIYSKQYFFDEYKKQYGKTYEQDFESIKQTCLKRINVILKIKPFNRESKVLDIGCAYGPFLKAASENGLTPYGTDISSDAIKYVQNKLHFNSCVSAFPNFNSIDEFNIKEFDIVTMWYVIEHFYNLNEVLVKVNSLVKKDGIFAFSTPSGQGISALRNRKSFYIQSPSDHFTIWEPFKANKQLSKYGFKIVKIVSTGHHPERFPFIKKHNFSKDSLPWKITNLISKIFRLGDTVEIYCKKIK